ncbi:hypothetical protein GGI07_002033 [Coemansia sp. Benny D115]|nr:hypothetical protein GGI07_002033 [Coemansia sp. Benny D115]
MDETTVSVMHINVQKNGGDLVAARVAIFSCDSCNVIIAMTYPDRLHPSSPTLDIKRHQDAISQPRRDASIHVSRETRIRSCLVLGRSDTSEILLPNGQSSGVFTNPDGPVVVFATNSISNLLEIDGDELIGSSFLRLVAPESLTAAAQFLADVVEGEDVVFTTLYLLYNPLDTTQGVESRKRVEVEFVGAKSEDGTVLLCRKVRVWNTPRTESLMATDQGNHADLNDGYISLADLLSSDPDTSDCPTYYAKALSHV